MVGRWDISPVWQAVVCEINLVSVLGHFLLLLIFVLNIQFIFI